MLRPSSVPTFRRTRSPGRRRSSILLCAIAACSLLIAGCDQAAIRQVGARTALRGQESCDAALKVYARLDSLADLDKEQQDFVTLLTRPAASTLPLPDKPRAPFEVQLAPRVRAYRSLRKAYAALYRLSDTAFADQTQEAAEALTDSVNALKGIPDLPAPVSSLLPALSGFVVGRIQAKEIRKHNLALHSLIRSYRTLWESDKPIWEKYITRVYKDYAQPLESLTPDQFDEERLRELVKEPYTKVYLVNLYKLQRREEARGKQQEVQTELDAVDQSFALLERAHKELAAQNPSFSDVLATLESIGSTLENVGPRS